MSKVALVTGGVGGLGSAICRSLAKDGCTVVSTYFSSQEKANDWQSKAKNDGFDFKLFKCDVSDFDSCWELMVKVKQEVGPVDILVNNAGITSDATIKKMTLENWNKVIHTNLDSVFNLTKQVIDDMTEKGWGRIINISSINGQKGQFGQANYSAAKAGIHGFTMSVAQEVARKGVTVNTIAPGYVATDMVMSVPEEIRNKIISAIPVGRLGKPEEIAGLVAFLASDLAAFITGSELAINGGQHMM